MLLGKLSAFVFKDDRNKSNISVSGRCTLLYVLERNYFRKECESNQKYTLTVENEFQLHLNIFLQKW